MPNHPYEEAEDWAKRTVSAWGDDGDRSPHHHRVLIGQWETAHLAVSERSDGTLSFQVFTLAKTAKTIYFEERVAPARTQPGEASPDVARLLRELRDHEATILPLMPDLLEISCQDALAAGMQPEDIVEVAKCAVVRDVMEG